MDIFGRLVGRAQNEMGRWLADASAERADQPRASESITAVFDHGKTLGLTDKEITKLLLRLHRHQLRPDTDYR